MEVGPRTRHGKFQWSPLPENIFSFISEIEPIVGAKSVMGDQIFGNLWAEGGVVILSHYSVHSATASLHGEEVKGFFFSRKEGKITKNDLY